jgi:hypothetical protein
MNDSQVRGMLLESIPDAPPPGYSAQSLLAAGARNRRRRSLVAAGASLLGVVVVSIGAAVVPDLLPPEGSTPPAAAPIGYAGPLWPELDPSPYCDAAADAPTATPEEITAAYQEYVPPHPTEAPAAIEARLTCYFMSVVPDHLPAAGFYVDPYRIVDPPAELLDGPPLRVGLYSLVGSADDPNGPVFSTGAIVADALGVGTIEFRVYPALESPRQMADFCLARPTACELRSGPHGEVVGVWSVAWPGGYRLVNVDVHLGHSVAMAVATNVDPTARPGMSGVTRVDEGYVLGRQLPPLSAEELIEVLASPQLAVS